MTPGAVIGIAGAFVCWYWMVFRGLTISAWEVLGVGLCVLTAGYIAGGVWQFKQFKYLLQHGLGISSQPVGDNQMNDERIL
jgi:hypothetical protein